MVLRCDSSASCYIWKQKPVALGQFDRESDKNKLHPLFPIQTEMFPEEWGKGSSLQGGKVLTRSKTHCLFSIKWCHNWLHNIRTQLQMGIWNIPTPGPADFVNIQLKEKSKFKMKQMFFFVSQRAHAKLRRTKQTTWGQAVWDSQCPGWSLLLNSISVMCEECFPSKPDQNCDKIDFPNYFDLQFSMSRMHVY